MIKIRFATKEDLQEMIGLYVDNNPENQTARYNFAIMCEQLNNIDLAKNNYNQILKINAKHWKSIFNLYLIYIKEKKYEKALNLVNDILISNLIINLP